MSVNVKNSEVEFVMEADYSFLNKELVSFDANIRFGGANTLEDNRNAFYQVEDTTKFLKFLGSSLLLNSRIDSKENENALDALNSKIELVTGLNLNDTWKVKQLRQYVSDIISTIKPTEEIDISDHELAMKAGLKYGGTWFSWIGNPL